MTRKPANKRGHRKAERDNCFSSQGRSQEAESRSRRCSEPIRTLQAVSQAVNDLIQFVQTAWTARANTATLDLTIDDLAQSIAELSSPAIPLSKLPAQDADSKTSNSWREAGFLGPGSGVSALNRKLRVVDETIRLTDNFLLSAKNIHTPMSSFITRVLQKTATSTEAPARCAYRRNQGLFSHHRSA